jgi:hypothetical protein
MRFRLIGFSVISRERLRLPTYLYVWLKWVFAARFAVAYGESKQELFGGVVMLLGYSRGDVCTNTVESSFAILKRGL